VFPQYLQHSDSPISLPSGGSQAALSATQPNIPTPDPMTEIANALETAPPYLRPKAAHKKEEKGENHPYKYQYQRVDGVHYICKWGEPHIRAQT
jgi:hypothetical protein